MEPLIAENHPDQNPDVKTGSAENFQKFIYELFDKNGILNDLRAYLRGHIVDVLKNAQTGDPTSCQKHFTQRLESTFQAINMLVAEYLLCLEFNYSLSVFVSEIPLANMVFGFAKSLMDLGADGEASGLRFKENDVWSILNCLGVKCDAEHANKIVEMYKTQEKTPLLLCILKCVHLCDMEQLHTVSSLEGSVSSSKSSDTEHKSSPALAQCKHYAFCKACRRRYRRLKEKYRQKKNHHDQNVQGNVNVETLMKNIGVLERSLVDEMFEQLRSVYETEIDMFKAEHDDKIKNSLASHAQHFQRMKNKLEESFKAREAALETNIVHKKRFLWGLARALRAQHSQMTRAMRAVNKQSAELAAQEQNLKTQRTEAEKSLKQHAEEMRQQIADELTILERHLESMKTERDSINRERSQTDINYTKMNNNEVKNHLQTHYNLLKDELDMLKMSIENALPPKSVVERGMVTEDGKGAMNNEVRVAREEVRPKQVVNDLKKQKNVNFSPCKSGGESSPSTGSSSSEDLDLRQFTQREMSLRSAQAHDQGEMRQSPAPVPRIQRRHLLNRWRTLRRRVSPLGGSELAASSLPAEKLGESVGISIQSPSPDPRGKEVQQEEPALTPSRDNSQPKADTVVASQKTREKSPRSVLKEAKEKLKTVTVASARREKSPSATLREAKLRLRKLEIEAEAVARSYRDYRRRRDPTCADQQSIISRPVIETNHREETSKPSKSQERVTNSLDFNMDKYLKKYQINLDVGQERSNKNTDAVLKTPIPEAYLEVSRNVEPIPKHDYLEKPILEFRKLYYTNPGRIHTSTPKSRDFKETLPASNSSSEKVLKELSELRKEKNNKRKELEILKQNMNKIYDLQDEPMKETVEMSKETERTNIIGNLLTVEVENVSEVRDLNAETKTNMLVIVEGSVDSKEHVISEHADKEISTKMTIVVSPKQFDGKKDINDRVASVKSPSQQANCISNGAKEMYEDVQIEIRNIPDEASGDNDPKHLQVEIRNELDNARGDKDFNDIQNETRKSPGEASGDKDLDKARGYRDFDIRNGPNEASGDKDPHLQVEIGNRLNFEIPLEAHNQISDGENTEAPYDYPDDFSNDVDNYKSDDNSPISLPKTSEDENFWD